MALEDLTGADKYVANLVITNPLSADDRREGDDHIRGIKNVLKNSFPTLAGPVTFSDYVLKAGDAMTGALQLANGTVAAPGLAWASEPGLGFYRDGAGTWSAAASGARVFSVDSVTGAATTVGLWSRAANGVATVSLINQPAGAANFNQLQLTAKADGGALIANFGSGSAASGTITYQAPNHYFGVVAGGAAAVTIQAIPTESALLNINKGNSGATQALIQGQRGGLHRWIMVLGGSGVETGGNAGSDFNILRYNDAGDYIDSPLTISRATGNTTTANLICNTLATNGIANTGLTTTAALAVTGSADLVALELGPKGGSGNAVLDWHTGGAADYQARMIMSPGTDNQIFIQSTSNILGWSNTDTGGGDIFSNIAGSTSSNRVAFGWRGDGTLGLRIDFSQIGVIVPVAPSDIRLKTHVAPISYGLAEVLAIAPIEFEYDREKFPAGAPVGIQYGFDAAKVEAAIPNTAREHEGFKHLNVDVLVPVLWQAVRELSARIEALEAAR